MLVDDYVSKTPLLFIIVCTDILFLNLIPTTTCAERVLKLRLKDVRNSDVGLKGPFPLNWAFKLYKVVYRSLNVRFTSEKNKLLGE